MPDKRMVTICGHNGPPLKNDQPRVEWSHDPKRSGRDPVIFEAAIKLFNFCHWPIQLSDFIYTGFTVVQTPFLFEHYIYSTSFALR